jgi:hypothetical protein
VIREKMPSDRNEKCCNAAKEKNSNKSRIFLVKYCHTGFPYRTDQENWCPTYAPGAKKEADDGLQSGRGF